MADTAPPKWELLKEEGNAHFAQGRKSPHTLQFRLIHSAAAFAKYSEAITLSPKNAILYSNRAAALIKMGKLDAAQNDATRFPPRRIIPVELQNWTQNGSRAISVVHKL